MYNSCPPKLPNSAYNLTMSLKSIIHSHVLYKTQVKRLKWDHVPVPAVKELKKYPYLKGNAKELPSESPKNKSEATNSAV